MKSGYDISDWLSEGHGIAELGELVRSAALFEPDSAAAGNTSSAPYTRVSDVSPERVQWLWPGRLALGKITILDGDPGTGKSILYCDIAARVTSGRAWPDGTKPIQGSVVIVTVEDDIADTIRPRLEAAGAALDRVVVMGSVPVEGGSRPISLPQDTDLIVQVCREVDARLLIIDPLMAHLSMEHSANQDQDVRVAVSGLMDALPGLRTACLIVRHLNKQQSTKALYRGSGSIGIVGAARIGLLVAEHPEDEDLRVLAPTKNNLGPRAASLSFGLHPSVWRPDIPVVHFEGPVTITADGLLLGGRGSRRSKMDETRDWLVEQLGDGPLPVQVIRERCERDGYSIWSLEKVKTGMVKSCRWGGPGDSGHWYWVLVGHEPSVDQVRRLDQMMRALRPQSEEATNDVESSTAPIHTINTPLTNSAQNQRSGDQENTSLAGASPLREYSGSTGGDTADLFDDPTEVSFSEGEHVHNRFDGRTGRIIGVDRGGSAREQALHYQVQVDHSASKAVWSASSLTLVQ